MTRRTAFIICPGRGTYNTAELGYLDHYHRDKSDFISLIDDIRVDAGQTPISEIDGMDSFKPSVHGRGDNASLLIYACALADFQSIDRVAYDIIGVTGNSMGWYLSLAIGGALSLKNGAKLVNTMGQIMTDNSTGGQVVYSLVDDDWQADRNKQQAVNTLLKENLNLSMSIYLGGMAIIAGDDAGVKTALSTLPGDGRFPFHIRGHSAFHSGHLDHCVPLARTALAADMFTSPSIPMIDGVGNIWAPYSTNASALYDYTLGRQINETYNFSKAVEVAVKEFAPDVFIVLGPGATMGAPVAQSLIAQNWQGVSSKTAFKTRQSENPIILSMGIPEQRKTLI